jgi:hypothetical protein
MDYFKFIPIDIIEYIFKTFDQKTICRLSMVCKDFKRICDNNEIWKKFYILTIHYKWRITKNSVHKGEVYIPKSIGETNYPFLFIKNGCMKCQENMIKENNFLYRRPLNMSINEWREDIKCKWKTLNEIKGLNQLCQDSTHYYINTLEIPIINREYKKYKKIILKKLLSKYKNKKKFDSSKLEMAYNSL